MRNRSCLVLLLVLVTFWIAFALFVVSAIAAPRREAEFPVRPSSGASQGERSPAPWQRGRDGVLAVSAGVVRVTILVGGLPIAPATDIEEAP